MSNNATTHGMSLSAGLRLASRDLRGGWAGFLIFFACTALGVATIAAVGVINASITRSVERDAAALLGGDIALEQPNNPIETMPPEIPAEARRSDTVRTNAIAFNTDDRSLAVEIKAVDANYPLYGTVETEPAGAIADLLAGDGIVVERSVLSRLGVDVGATLRIGEGDVTIAGIVLHEPDRIGGYVSLGPRVFVSTDTLSRLGVLQPGAIARYEYRFTLPDPDGAEVLEEQLEAAYATENWRVRSRQDVQPRVARFTDRLATYLMMAGLTALVIGGLGIGLSIRSYLQAKTPTIATLRCIGAKSRDIAVIYGTQIAILALGGALAGVILGQLLPFLLTPLVNTLLPVPVTPTIELLPLLYAGACGVMAASLFGLLPLLAALDVKPAALFRVDLEENRRGRDWQRIAIFTGAGVVLAILVIAGSPRVEVASVFVAAMVGVMLLLALAAKGFILASRRLRPFMPLKLRMAMASLDQPGHGAVSVVVAMGSGLAALVMVGLLQHNLESEVAASLPDRAPDLVFIDIQPHQVEPFKEAAAAEPEAEILQIAPVLRARVTSIAGVPVDQVEIAEDARWTVRRDRGLTYQAEMPDHTELAEGEWWPSNYRGEPLVSVEDEIALGYGVGLGDKIGFNILGREVEATIANLRKEIDWSRGRLDFVFVLSPGLIEQAPHTTIAAIDLPNGRIDPFIQAMAPQFPNVTPLEIGDAIDRVGDILGKIAAAIRIVALVTLATGVIVLAAAVLASRRQHIRRAVLLKVLGSRRGDILGMLLTEHAGLGLIAAVIGGTLGALAAYVLVVPVMGLGWSLAWTVLIGNALAAVILAMLVGGLVLRRALTVPAATILRQGA